MKRFLWSVLIFCAAQMPVNGFAATASGDLAERLFTFDAKLAPIKLEYVDFKIDRARTAEDWGKDIGKYNFKLFGCKRADKLVVLNQGRAMRRDMKFGDVFFEEMNELFPVVVAKDSPYYPYSIGDVPPGYLITAEIKDLYINVCDHYDWRTRVYSQLRSGSAEIKVLWRVITPYNRKLYWEDVTHGYARLEDPIRNGEVRLAEKAFADALVRLIGMPGFLETMRNKPDAAMLARAKAEFEEQSAQHIRSRNKLKSSYRRKRTKFYSERHLIRDLEMLEKLAPDEETMQDDFDRGMANVHGLGAALLSGAPTREAAAQLESGNEREKESDDEYAKTSSEERGLADEYAGLPPEERELYDKLAAGAGGSELTDNEKALLARLLQDGKAQGLLARLLKDGRNQGFSGRLLKDGEINRSLYGRVLNSSPLLRLFDGYLFTADLDREAVDAILDGDLSREKNKYGFIVSPIDGWITINNQKPFRYLSPVRIYRIRASVVAVSNADDVGSGLVIAPSLVLTNYSVTKSSPYAKIEFLDGRMVQSIVLRVDKEKDVALLYMPPAQLNKYNWPIPLRLDLPDVGEKFYAIGTPMRGGFEGAMEDGKVAGYRYMDAGVDILTTTNVQSVTLGGILVDENGNAIGLAHAGESLTDSRRDGFIPIGDAFDALKVRILDRDEDETPTQKALRLKKSRDNYIK